MPPPGGATAVNKSGGLGMRFHQAVSFSGPLMGVDRCRAVFWPGCALMNMDPALLERTLDVLRREEPGMGLSTCCCGQPTRYLEPEKFHRRRDRLVRLLEGSGVERVYAACPNCMVQLRELPGLQVRPIWSVLAARLREGDIVPREGAVVLHDPCPMRQEAGEQEAVRALLRRTGLTVVEPEHTREHTLCCGNFHMLRATDPEKSARIRQRRVAEFPGELPVTSYCEGCLDAFRSEGRKTAHVLELLFGTSDTRGWGNRIAFTRRAKARRTRPEEDEGWGDGRDASSDL